MPKQFKIIITMPLYGVEVTQLSETLKKVFTIITLEILSREFCVKTFPHMLTRQPMISYEARTLL